MERPVERREQVAMTMNWRQRLQRLRLRLTYSIGALLYIVFNAVVLAGKRPKPQPGRVAIVFPDLLGDVVMWLPFGQALVTHLQRQRREVFVVCDETNQAMLREVLKGCEVLGISRSSARLSHPIARMKWLRRLRGLRVEQSFCMSHPRGTMKWGESIVWALASSTVAFDNGMRDRPRWEIRWTNRWYSRLVHSDGRIDVHVRQRFSEYLRAVGVSQDRILPVSLPSHDSLRVTGDYWVLAPGASQPYRQWPVERYTEVARSVSVANPKWRCVIVGTGRERPMAAQIAAALNERAVDLSGQTSALDLFNLIAGAHFLLGNDSGAGHIAAAVGTTAVVVTGGGHWGLCYPYAPSVGSVLKMPVVVSHPMPCFGCDWICAYTSRQDQPFPCIEKISIDAVNQTLERVLTQSHALAPLASNQPAAGEAAQWTGTAQSDGA